MLGYIDNSLKMGLNEFYSMIHTPLIRCFENFHQGFERERVKFRKGFVRISKVKQYLERFAIFFKVDSFVGGADRGRKYGRNKLQVL